MKLTLALLAIFSVAVSSLPTTKKVVPTPVPAHKSHNFRHDFDQVLFAFVEEHLIRAEQTLFLVQREVEELQNENAVHAHLKDSIILQITHEINTLEETLGHLENQKESRQDFNDLELYFVEKTYGDCKLLIKHFSNLKASLK